MASLNGDHANGASEDLRRFNAASKDLAADVSVTPKAQNAAELNRLNDQLSAVKPEGTKAQELDARAMNTAPAPPTIIIEEYDGDRTIAAVGTSQDPEKVQEEEDSTIPPGGLPPKAAVERPDYYITGWREASGIDKQESPEEKDRRMLDLWLADQYYGDWYHNSAVIVVAVLTTHFLTRFGFGFGWLFIVLAFCATYYSTSVTRFRRNARDDIQRELVKTRLASETETVDWMNNFLDRFWLIYEPIMCSTIQNTVDQILSTSTPAFLDSLRLPVFTLGSKAPRIESVRTFPRTEKDIVIMDWKFSFTPSDKTDMTKRQIDAQENPKIQLAIRVGKGLATAALPVLVENMSMRGHIRIRMKLMTNFPHVETLDLSFLEKPDIDFSLKPIGGETFGFDIANMPGLSSFIKETTHSILGPMMYEPNVFTLNLEQMLSGKPYDAAIGVIEVNIRSARGLKGQKITGGTPDPYVSLSIGNRAELARTKYKNNTYNPTWMETKYLLITDIKDILTLNVYDYNDHRKDSLMSTASFEMAKLLEDSTQEDLVSPLLKDGKERGELRYDVNYYPVIEAEPGKEEMMDSTVGIVRLVLHQAKELDNSKSMSGELNPIARVFLNNSDTSSFSSICIKHTNNPVWESPFEFLCTDKENATVTIKVIDDRDFLKDPVVGYMSIKVSDLLDAKGKAGRDWFPLSHCKTGRLRVSAEWKPLAMAGSLHGSDTYKPPIGVVRLHMLKATDVKNVEATLGGKSDPYVRVQVQNVTKARTEVINNNLSPVWDEILYVPVHSLRENLILEAMDYQHLTKDRSLGSTELHVSDLAVESNEDPQYAFASTGVQTHTDNLLLEKGNAYKGTLHYTAEFIPGTLLKGFGFDSHNYAAQKADHESEHSIGGHVPDGNDSESDEDPVPKGLTIGIDAKKEPKDIPPPIGVSAVTRQEKGMSVDTTDTADTEASNNKPGNGNVSPTSTKSSKPKVEEKGIEMTTEELLSKRSGIVVFRVISGQLYKKARLEVLMDNGYWPCFSTIKSSSHHAQWDYVGEGFVKEIDFGRVWLRLNEADIGEKDDIAGEWSGDIKDFLRKTLAGPQTFELIGKDDKRDSTVVIEARYIPVPVQLEPRETINNQGILRVDLLDGSEIRGVDRSGKSDPFAVFTLNGQKVFKSQTKKKTITPEWNENFEVSVPSRAASEFTVELFDWNQIEQAKSLGVGVIDLNSIEPFEAVERIIPLSTVKHGEKGQIRVRLVFRPEIIVKSRKATTTFSTAGRAMTTIGGLPVSAGKGVFHGVAGVFKRDKDEEEVVIVPDSAGAGKSSIADVGTMSFPSSESGHATSSEPGTLRVTVVEAKGLPNNDWKPYATLRLGDKEVKTKHTGKTDAPEWNESFVFAASAFTPKLFVWLHDHKTLGKDKEIGETEVEIWHHVKTEGISTAEVTANLRPAGHIRLRLEFDATSNPNHTTSHDHSRTISLATPSRFSLRGRRPNDDDAQSIRG